MKKHKLLMLTFASVAVLLSSCTISIPITSKYTFDKTVEEVKFDLAKLGYAPSGSSTETKNDIYVEGTSYSKYAGYGSKMANDFVTTDTYRFSHEDGSIMRFSVSYKLYQAVAEDLVYVTERGETSNAKQYNAVCGSNSPIKKIKTMPQDASIEIPDLFGNTALGVGAFSKVSLI